MQCNVSKLDRVLRMVVALLLGILAFLGQVSGILAFIFTCVVFYLVLTGIMRYCPVYDLFRLKDKGHSHQKNNN